MNTPDERGIIWSPHHVPVKAMPEPDFEQIARGIASRTYNRHNNVGCGVPEWERLVTEISRQVWNARGAADLALINDVGQHAVDLIRGEWGEDGSAVELAEALTAIRTLDR